MSFNRENVVWQSQDGSWNIGFYDVYWTGDDPEWDVEYNYNAFQWAATGFSSAREAEDAWQGSNPGSHYVMEYNDVGEAAKLDEMARAWKESPDYMPYAMSLR